MVVALSIGFLLLFSVPPGRSGNVVTCDRKKSRLARDVLSRTVLLEAATAGYELPSECPWAPSRDMLGEQEHLKNKVSSREWQCGLCGKIFTSEDWLDSHFDRKHKPDAVSLERDICLADYCDVLRCNLADTESKLYRDVYDERAKVMGLLESGCSPEKMQRLKYTCQGIIHKCANPDHGPDIHRFYDNVVSAVCAKLTCDTDKTSGHHSAERPVLSYVLVGFLMIVLLLYYVGIYVYNSENGGFNERSSRLLADPPRRPWWSWSRTKPKRRIL
eukprot:gb/GEZN01011832.1/.p1 GENE.gb/GEZN01011832.1/~~gb/GEZN01011832.1/.p1  ORF type:complete len:274 (+),score=7.31 gb/GEZN01011832.1/:68-889(+)